jgi:hypothetical protein
MYPSSRSPKHLPSSAERMTGSVASRIVPFSPHLILLSARHVVPRLLLEQLHVDLRASADPTLQLAPRQYGQQKPRARPAETLAHCRHLERYFVQAVVECQLAVTLAVLEGDGRAAAVGDELHGEKKGLERASYLQSFISALLEQRIQFCRL